MKNIKNYFHKSEWTYYHHRYGTHIRKNRRNTFAVWFLSLAMVSGCFLLAVGLIIPLMKNVVYSQESHNNQSINPRLQDEKKTDEKVSPININNPELEAIVKDKLSQLPVRQQWSVYIYDLKNDSTVEVNTRKTQDAASLYKLFLLARLEEKLPYDQWSYTWLSDQNVSDCVYNMLRQDDDPCSEDLADYLGGESVDKYNQNNGFRDTRLSGNLGRQTTAREVGRLMVDLKKGQILSDNARRFVFDGLYSQELKKGIQPGCGDCRTANKLGQLTDVAYDAGVVTHGKRSYVLVAMSQGGSFKQISQLTDLVDNYLIKN